MQRKLTQEDINAAVLKTMETQVMPSEYARAYEQHPPLGGARHQLHQEEPLKEEEPELRERPQGPSPSRSARAGPT
jgi:hypothetical protein